MKMITEFRREDSYSKTMCGECSIKHSFSPWSQGRTLIDSPSLKSSRQMEHVSHVSLSLWYRLLGSWCTRHLDNARVCHLWRTTRHYETERNHTLNNYVLLLCFQMWQQKVGVNEGGVGDLNDTHTDGATEHDH